MTRATATWAAAGWLILAAGTHAAPPLLEAREVTAAEMDARLLTPRARAALDQTGARWRHLQSAHFVAHFEQEIFARKILRMAEFFYDHIAADLPDARDRLEGRSHLFLFPSDKAWESWRAAVGDVPAWTFSQAVGPVLFLRRAGTTAASGDVLAHEMTHLVLHRFLDCPGPLWLHEGLASFYEEFAHAAFKGVYKSRRAAFPPLDRVYPLPALFDATDYPATPSDLMLFYRTAKYAVAWLRLKHAPERFSATVQALCGGRPWAAVFAELYGWSSPREIEAEFLKFAR